MVNRPKQIGTAAETAVVKWARLNGFEFADRQPLRGNRDAGDVTLCPGVIVESKAHKSAAAGQPSAALLEAWLEQTDVETANADADYGLLVVKRAGTTDPGKWWCYLRLGELLRLMDAPHSHRLANRRDPVHMSLASACVLLRHAGYGTALDVEGEIAS